MGEPRKFFGTDGIRGKANVFPMTCEVVTRLGRAVTYFFQKKDGQKQPTIIVGKDTRLSCYMLEQAFAAGVCAQGGMAILTGPLPTPGIAFCVRSMRAQAGVMISASHNLFTDNGIKIFDRTGHKLSDSIERKLEEMIENPDDIPIPLDDRLGRARRLDEVMGRYIVYAKDVFNAEDSLEHMSLVLDCAHGASYRVAPMIFSELGARVSTLGVEPNGRNINLHCGALYPQQCARKVCQEQADMGLAFDGDADRLVVVDESGTVVHGDQLIGMLARYLKETGQLGASTEIVGTVMSNLGLEHYLERQGLQLYRSEVGDRYVVERMQHSGCRFGGEASGHLVFKALSTTGDGIISALKVLECVRYYARPIGELVGEISLYPQVLRNVAVAKTPPLDSLDSVQSCLARVKTRLGTKGRVLLRYSGTEPVARVMVEGREQQLVEELCGELVSELQGALGHGQ